MLKRLLCLLYVINHWASTDATGQITINAADMPSIGDTILMATDTMPAISSVGGTGMQIWDFTSLQIISIDTLLFVDPASTAFSSDFSTSNLARESDQQIRYQTLSSATLINDGYAGDDPFGAGLTIAAPFSPKQKVLDFPSTDGSSFSDTSGLDQTIETSSLGLPVPDVDSIRLVHHSWATSIFDAYGTMDIPGDSYTTIRQLYTENTLDSIFAYCSNPAGCNVLIATLPFGWSFLPSALTEAILGIANPSNDTTYTYNWYANNEDVPVAWVETDNPGGTVLSAGFKMGNVQYATISGSSNVSCAASCDGNATVSVSGGIPPFTYAWNDPMNQSTATATGLCAGTYAAFVVDAANDTSSLTSVIITEPSPLVLTISSTGPSCNPGNDGTATAIVAGGTSPYNYLWNTNPPQLTASAINLDTGIYVVAITDGNGCTLNDSVSLMAPNVPSVTAMGSDPSACGVSDGIATATATGGTPPYTYIWDDPGNSSNSTINGLAAGTYSVTLTDASSCTAITSVILAAPSAPSLSMSSTNLSCYGDTNGTASGLVSGGTSPYTYLWSNGQALASLTGLTAGVYTLTITDGAGCIVIDSTSILEPPLLSLSTSNTGATCNLADGIASVFASGGTPPYVYQWDGIGNQTNSTATGLIAGVYGVTVTDANGCIETESEIVNNIGAPTLTTSKQDAFCKGSSDGLATALATGGLPPYTYQWNDPLAQTNVTATGLAADTYVIIVTDASGCIVSETLTIGEPAEALVLAMSYVNVTSSIICDGTASANPSGGTAPYAYSWSDPMSQTTETATGLCIGFYNVSVTDANGCVSDGTIYVDSLVMGIDKIELVDQLEIYPNPTTGILTIEGIAGTTAVYNIYSELVASTLSSTLDLSNAAAGIYFVRVVDEQRKVYVVKILKE